MAEPQTKVLFDYREPENVYSQVPGEQNIRESIETSELAIAKCTQSGGNKADSPGDYTLTPVVTVTKNEASYTKGDRRLHKITVTENVSMEFKHLFKTADNLSGDKTKTKVVHNIEIKHG